jgi:hypothetical protein
MRRRDRLSQFNWLSARPEDLRAVGGLGVHRHCLSSPSTSPASATTHDVKMVDVMQPSQNHYEIRATRMPLPSCFTWT